MTPLTSAVLKTGLISPQVIEQFRRWKAPIDLPPDIPTHPPKDIEEASRMIEEALESEGLVVTRETDLQVLQQYLSTQQQGTLHLEFFSPDPTLETEGDIPITFGVTPLGEYVIPWKNESLTSEILNGACYLSCPRAPGVKVFFTGLRELYFGDHKAFMVCTGKPDREPIATLATGDADGDPS